MRNVKIVVLVIALCAVAIGYLYQHYCSMRVTTELQALEYEKRFLSEEVDEVRAEVAGLSSFARLESLWTAAGRPVFVPEPIPEELAEEELKHHPEEAADSADVERTDAGSDAEKQQALAESGFEVAHGGGH